MIVPIKTEIAYRSLCISTKSTCLFFNFSKMGFELTLYVSRTKWNMTHVYHKSYKKPHSLLTSIASVFISFVAIVIVFVVANHSITQIAIQSKI